MKALWNSIAKPSPSLNNISHPPPHLQLGESRRKLPGRQHNTPFGCRSDNVIDVMTVTHPTCCSAAYRHEKEKKKKNNALFKWNNECNKSCGLACIPGLDTVWLNKEDGTPDRDRLMWRYDWWPESVSRKTAKTQIHMG